MANASIDIHEVNSRVWKGSRRISKGRMRFQARTSRCIFIDSEDCFFDLCEYLCGSAKSKKAIRVECLNLRNERGIRKEHIYTGWRWRVPAPNGASKLLQSLTDSLQRLLKNNDTTYSATFEDSQALRLRAKRMLSNKHNLILTLKATRRRRQIDITAPSYTTRSSGTLLPEPLWHLSLETPEDLWQHEL